MKFTKEQLERVVPELKKKHEGAELHLLSADGEDVIARAPTAAEYERFLDHASEKKTRSKAADTLARSCLLQAAAGDLDQLLERRPGLVTTFGGKLLEIAGAVDEVEAKKL